jgi:hypothetical protein
VSFDSYTMKYKGYISHGDSNSNEPARSANFLSRAGKVLAYQVRGRWTQDAPPPAVFPRLVYAAIQRDSFLHQT